MKYAICGVKLVEDINMIDKIQNKTHKWKWLNQIYIKLFGYRLEPKKSVYQMGDVIIGHPETLKTLGYLADKM